MIDPGNPDNKCPIPHCFSAFGNREQLTDHLSREHDVFTALVTGELQLVIGPDGEPSATEAAD